MDLSSLFGEEASLSVNLSGGKSGTKSVDGDTGAGKEGEGGGCLLSRPVVLK
jgi:hypothetical protein